MLCVSKFMPFFTRYGSYIGFTRKSDLPNHSKALALVPFDRPHMISY